MAHLMRGLRPAAARGLAGLTATLMLSACAQTTDLLPKSNLALTQESDGQANPGVPQNELQKATAYWGQEYAKQPAELKPALNYARNLKALGEKQKAMSVLQAAGSFHESDKELAGEYGRLALELDQVAVAGRMLEIADDPTKPDWKVISARGTVLAKQGQYKQAIPFYERALQLSNNQPSVLNNLAMAHAMGGDPKQAETLLRQASSTPSPSTQKVNQNLALVLGLQGRYDEAKSVTAGSPSAMSGADNVDMLRRIVKIDPKTAPMPVPAAIAKASIPDFKTQVTTAIANAPATAQPFASAPLAANVATPATFKPAALDTTSPAKTVWQPEVTAAADTASTGLRGSAR